MIEDSDGPPTKRPFRNCPASSPTALPSTSVGLAQIQRGERLGCSVRPLILRGRKRAQEELTTEQAPIYSSERFIKTNLVAIRQGLEARGRLESEGDAYVQQLIEKMGGRFDSLVSTRKVTASQQSDSSVRKRLSSRSDCDLRALSCFVPLCGRSFDSLQVLAWHMSYAHQDVSSSDPRNTICYLCGYTMSTAKGKNAHLTTKHRSIAERHNMECIEQRGSIIAPGK
ncbi:unnamed protein product [Toxocara canis]|uniref:C2H2-type domain-containing protein n=1 Tax=Toxocara canis TaxID=6265 RepID=A0A183VFR9_TOXCA|nr:unnamed protein product [Toxocara canis]